MTALYYTVHKTVRHGRGYATKEYFKAFAQNFKQATVIGLIMTVLHVLVCLETYIMYQYVLNGNSFGKVYMVLVVVEAFVIMWTFYIFAYLARFKNTTMLILKNSAYFMASNFAEAVFMLIVFVLCGLLIVKWFWLLVALPALFMLVADFFIERVFRKYMTPEDLSEEDERNKVYKD